MIDNVVLTVRDVNKYIKNILEYDPLLNNIRVKGEISNYKRHSSGHLYFSIKDSSGKLNCVMFKGNTFSLNFEPIDGMEVTLQGYISLFEKNGNYQLYVEHMEKKGVGALYEKYQQLLKELGDKGYFEETRKKSLPFLPEKVAVVTSKTGAAVRDIISVIRRRNPKIEIIVCPVAVQGVGAGDEIAKMISFVSENSLAQVLIVGRGGGSIEELWAFNEEAVAEAIYNCSIPVVSAVGHEVDYTICDFVSDLRAPTPSAAGELVAYPLEELLSVLGGYERSFFFSINKKIEALSSKLEYIQNKRVMKRSDEFINNQMLYIESLWEKINKIQREKFTSYERELNALERIIKGADIENILNRGFALVYEGDCVISNFDKVKNDASLKIVMSADEAQVKMISKKSRGEKHG